MLKLKKASTAFVLSLILGVSLFSTGAFAQSAHSVQSVQSTNTTWCGGGCGDWGGGWGGGWGGFGMFMPVIPVFITPFFGGWGGGCGCDGGFGGWGGGWGW